NRGWLSDTAAMRSLFTASRHGMQPVRHLSQGDPAMLTRRTQLAAVVLILAVLTAVFLFAAFHTSPSDRGQAVVPGSDGYLFCFWNVENLFDDHDDRRTGADAEFDAWFARDPAALQLKLDRLSEAIVRLNDGKGPDILAVVEVENERAADLLRQALNRRL